MAKAVEVTGTYRDQAGKTATNTQYVTQGSTLAQYVEALRGLAVLIDDVTTAVLSALNFTVTIDLTGLTGNIAAATSDVEEVGAFQFATADGRPVNINVPAINTTMSPSGSDDLDQADTDVAAFISAMEDGIAVTGGTIIPTDVDEDDIAAIVYAREEVRNSGSRG